MRPPAGVLRSARGQFLICNLCTKHKKKEALNASFFFTVLLSYSVNLKKQSRRPPAKAQNFSYKSSLPAPWNCTRESEIPRRYNHEPAPTSSKSETPRQRNCKSCRARKKKRKSRAQKNYPALAKPLSVPAKGESVSAQAQSRPRACRPQKRNPAIAELRPSGNRRKKKTEEKIYRLRGRIFIVGLFGSGVASSVSSSSKSGINAFSRFSGAADFSAGCSASTRMARLPLL